MSSQELAAVGIDFGTENSCVGVFRNGTVEIVANAQGARTTPSTVAFTAVELLVGTSAQNQLLKNLDNTVVGFKHLLGRKFGDVTLKDHPFEVVDKDGKYAVKVTLKGEEKIFTAEELVSMVLKDLKVTAEAYLGLKVEEAVFSVPSQFNEAQRQCVVEAAKLAGLRVSRMLDEPIAAAIGYGLDCSVEDGGKAGSLNALVFDLGASTTEVSIINVQDGIFQVKANTVSEKVSGDTLNNAIVDHFVKEFEKTNGVNLRTEPSAKKALRRMYLACEVAKQTLAASGEAHIELDALYEGIDLFDSVTAARFQIMARASMSEMLRPIREALKTAQLEAADINELIFVGGCTKIPLVQDNITRFFRNNVHVCTGVEPDEAVAYGAAVQAGVIVGELEENLSKKLVLDVAPLTIGIETSAGVMTPVISAGATIPCSRKVMFSTSEHNQTAVYIQVYEGERAKAADNKLLGRFMCSGIEAQPAGLPRVEVTFSLNAEGVLDLTATDGTANGQLTITADQGRASEADVKKAQADATANADADKEYRRNVEATAAFKLSLAASRSRADRMNGADRDSMSAMVAAAQKWLDTQSPAQVSDIQEKEDEIDDAFQVIADRINNADDDDLDLDDLDDLDEDEDLD